MKGIDVATIQCEIVSAEESLFSGAITSLSVRGTIGELGITPGHAPLLTGIAPGAVALRLDDGSEEIFFASGGYLEVQPGFVTLLADTALRAEDLDEAQAEEARQQAEKAMEDKKRGRFSSAATMMAEALAKQRTLEELRRRRLDQLGSLALEFNDPSAVVFCRLRHNQDPDRYG